MLIKAIGAFIVFFSCAACGLYLSLKDRFRAEELKEMKRGLMLLKSSIGYSSKPLYEAMIDISEKTENTVSEIFEDTGRLLKARKASSVGEAWRKTISDRRSRTYFTKNDAEMFSAFADILGGDDSKCQIENIDSVIDYIDKTAEELMRKNNKDARLFRSAGVLGGILIVVVLF